jgi:Potential Queuosine, Q, salvage protein family
MDFDDKRLYLYHFGGVICCTRRDSLALEEGIPFTDPAFYASEERCPDSLIQHIFRGAPQAKEGIPLFPERIAIMREVGAILCAVSV